MRLGIMRFIKQNASKIAFFTLFFILMPFVALADCDFAKDIKEMPDGTYSYSKGCHIEVGKRVKRLILVDQQVVELEKTVELKDLALSKQTERANLWMDTSVKMQDKIIAYDSAAKASKWFDFGLGVGVTVLSVWAAGQLRH